MNTKIYIARHSRPFRSLLGKYEASETEQLRNEKNPLSVEGENRAYQLGKMEVLKDVEILYSSHYVRAMATAKYIAENNIKLNVDERFGERKFGVNSMAELPKSFYEDQFKDWNYKLPNGESLNEVSKRMKAGILDLINLANGKTAMVVAHGTSLTAMLSNWCKILFNEKTKLAEIYFNNELIFAGNWEAPELFELEFVDNDLINIKNIKIEY